MSVAQASIAGIKGYEDIKGYLFFTECPKGGVTITGDVYGIPRREAKKNVLQKNGIHIHESGDVSKNCTCVGKHFTTRKGATHGGPNDTNKHDGDLGNLVSYGNHAHFNGGKLFVKDLKISGPKETSILDRSVVIHEGEDDLGIRGDVGSLETGNSGKIIACGRILLIAS